MKKCFKGETPLHLHFLEKPSKSQINKRKPITQTKGLNATVQTLYLKKPISKILKIW